MLRLPMPLPPLPPHKLKEAKQRNKDVRRHVMPMAPLCEGCGQVATMLMACPACGWTERGKPAPWEYRKDPNDVRGRKYMVYEGDKIIVLGMSWIRSRELCKA